jgi:diguanylate cyclase (GGDEF)-like protein/PAS domain S-box-containing protein
MPYQAKANLSALIESTEDLIWSVDLDYRLIAFNSALQKHIEDTFGVRPAVGMRPEDFVLQERVNLLPPLYDRARAEGSFRVEFSLADGRTLDLSFNPIVSDGEINGISVFGKDITERKTADKARALLASIVESSDDAIHAVNLDGTVASWNRGAEALFGYTASEIVGKCISILAPCGRGHEVPLFLESVANGGSISPFDTVLRGKDGRNIEVSLSISPIKNTAGVVVGASAIARDISSRKRFERELQEAEKKYRKIFDGALEGMFQTSLEGRPLAGNRAGANILGYDTVDEALSALKDTVQDVWVDPDERAKFLEQIKEHGVVRGFECRFKRRDGAIIWVSLSSRMVSGTNGQPPRIEGFVEDINERKQTRESLRESGNYLTEAQKFGNLGYYALDISSRVWTSSEAMDEIFGIDKDYPHTVEGWMALIHPDERAMLMDYLLNEVIGQRKDFDKEYRIVRVSDQTERWVHGTGRLEYSAKGRPLKMHGIIKDISEHKLFEMHLRESEERYRAIFEQIEIDILHTSLEGRILRCNECFARIVGYPLHEIPGMTYQQMTAPEDQAMCAAVFNQLPSGMAGNATLEKRYIRKDGSFTWVKLTVSTQRDAEGRALYYITVVEDINARKSTEQRLAAATEALQARETHYRTVFQTSVDGIAVSQMSDGRYIDVNKAFLDLMGFEREQVIGRTSLELNFWVDQGDRKKMLDAIREHSSLRDLQIRHVKKNGEIIWILVSATAIEIDGISCMLSVVRDITAAKAAEQRLADAVNALRASEERYRTVFRMNIDAVDICNLEDGRYIDVNDAFVACTGFQRDEVIGHTSLELGIWDNPADRNQLVEIIRRDGSCRNLEIPYRTKDGSLRWALLSVAIIDLENAPCILSVTRDITEAKAAAQRLTIAAEALRSSEERYRTVFETCFEGILIIRIDNLECIDVNRRFLNYMGFERQEVIGHTSVELNLWMDVKDRENLFLILHRNSICKDFEARFRKKNGDTVWAVLDASITGVEGVSCLFIVARDVTESRAAEQRLAAANEALRVSEESYRATFQLSIDAININRLSDGIFVDVNEAFLQFVGYEREEVIGRTSKELNFWVDPEVRQQMVETLRRGASCRDLKARFRRKNGEIVWGQASESILEIDGVPCILSVTRDISAAKAAEEQIRDLAFYDTLTHLPNRRLLMERLRQTLAAGSRTNRKRALLFVDLDNFKTLNDTLGHQTGDLLLQEVATRLSACIREADTVARLGGDEFVVMLEDLSDLPEEAAAQAESVGEKILAAIDQPFWLSGRECLSTSSIGITVFGNQRESTDEVLQQADIAMYQAKAAGRNSMRFFAPALQAAVNARAVLEEDIRQAIKASQFELYYQPQLDSIGLVGAEVLVRWNHPRRGLLLPGEFIPLSEETGLIQPLGDWVLENAFAQVAAWGECPDFSHISLAVNISARQFRQPSFVDKVLAALDRTGANPENIKLELTESMLIENIEDVIAKMTELKSHGLKFSLDDFGTGYSSLAYLKRLPLDQLKIDRSFVRDILADLGSRAIAQSVISLGRALGLSVIAECVETEEQRTLLSRLGCHAFQGFLFSPALPLDVFEKQWLCTPEFIVPIDG